MTSTAREAPQFYCRKDAFVAQKTKGPLRYDARDITVLEGLEPVRVRPGMYIGSTGPSGLHHLIRELVDNAVDEAMAGSATRIDVTILPNGSCRVSDDGRGIPVEEHPQYPGQSAAEIVYTTLHAGEKFGGGGYKVSGGLHGVGVSIVNALSTKLIATVYQNGKIYEQEYAGGVPQSGLKVIGNSDKTGTEIIFY